MTFQNPSRLRGARRTVLLRGEAAGGKIVRGRQSHPEAHERRSHRRRRGDRRARNGLRHQTLQALSDLAVVVGNELRRSRGHEGEIMSPPSTGNTEPEMKPAASPSRKAIVSATSIGLP